MEKTASLWYLGDMKHPLHHTIALVMGDPSKDGHGKSERILIHSNISKLELQASFKRGAEIIGADITKHFNGDWEPSIPEDVWQKLVDAGIAEFGWDTTGDLEDRMETEVDAEAYADLYLFTVSKGNPGFDFKYQMPETSIKIGGYGLFH